MTDQISIVSEFRRYPKIPHVYVMHRTSGFGVMESPIQEHEVIFASDSYAECRGYGDGRFPRDLNTQRWKKDTCR